MKNFLLTITLIVIAACVSGCNCGKNPTVQEQQQQASSYIVSQPPVTAKAGVKDPTNGFVKINPTFNDIIEENTTEKASVWFKDGLGAQIPAMDDGDILEVVNNDNQFLVYVANIGENEFRKYCEKLQANGYTANENDNWESYNMSNGTYDINLRFGQDGWTVSTIRAKMKDAPADTKTCN